MARRPPGAELSVPPELIELRIYLVRGNKVMLAPTWHSLYRVETFNLNKAVKRNINRFPTARRIGFVTEP
jgi:hypothetical protein